MEVSPNPEFIRDNNLKAITLLLLSTRKKRGGPKTTSLISTEDLNKLSNKKWIDMGMGNSY